MTTIKTNDGAEIFYKDWGPKDAQPMMFHHGAWRCADDWDVQMLFFVANGSRGDKNRRTQSATRSQTAFNSLLALGVTALFSVILSARGWWEHLPRPTAGQHKQGARA